MLRTDQQRLRHLRQLTEISRAITCAVAIDDVLKIAVERAAELIGTERVALLLADDSGRLSVRASTGLGGNAPKQFHEALDERLAGHLEALLRTQPTEFLAVPLVVGGHVHGILAAALPQGGRADDELEWLLSALADQAAVAIEKTRLDESIEFRERLMGIVSHDLRNPIGAIQNAADVLLMRDDVDERTTLIAATIRSSAARAIRMIVDLLDYTQARLSGGIPIRPRPADLLTIVRASVEEAKFAHPNRRIELMAIGSAQGEWDCDRVSQVVSNLIANALAYSPANAAVRVELHGDASTVRLAVQNDGPPIPADRLGRIFEPMQRGTNDVGTRGRSVGLGLYIVRSIVEAHAGEVGVRSTTENGTRFEVTLPRASGAN